MVRVGFSVSSAAYDTMCQPPNAKSPAIIARTNARGEGKITEACPTPAAERNAPPPSAPGGSAAPIAPPRVPGSPGSRLLPTADFMTLVRGVFLKGLGFSAYAHPQRKP